MAEVAASILEATKSEEIKTKENIIVDTANYLIEMLRAGKPLVVSTVYFNFNGAGVLPQFKKGLKMLAEFMSAYPEYSLEIVGHTDNKGLWDANILISLERAMMVNNFLVFNNKVPKEKIIITEWAISFLWQATIMPMDVYRTGEWSLN